MPRVRFALGISPDNAAGADGDALRGIADAARDRRVCAIGSCGLSDPVDAIQAEVFRRQIEIASESGLPLVVEAEGAYDAALAILLDAGFPPAGVLLRAFSGNAGQLAAWVGAGCHVSFDARAANDPVAYGTLARAVPEGRVLVESGAPHRALDKLTGFSARPDQVVFVADALSDAVSPSQLARNAATFFSGRP